MKKLVLFFFLLCNTSCYSQTLSVPYIHVRPAKSEAEIRDEVYGEGLKRYHSFTSAIDKLFNEMVNSIDMLPIDKVRFQSRFNELRESQNEEVSESPQIGLHTEILTEYGIAFDKYVLNPVAIQRAKTKYTRVLAWESFLRDKELLDKPYTNAKAGMSLSNREALRILYGTDKAAFNSLAWE